MPLGREIATALATPLSSEYSVDNKKLYNSSDVWRVRLIWIVKPGVSPFTGNQDTEAGHREGPSKKNLKNVVNKWEKIHFQGCRNLKKYLILNLPKLHIITYSLHQNGCISLTLDIWV